MNRNRLIPVVGVVIALLVLWFLFTATRPGDEDLEDGVVGADIEQENDGTIVVEDN